jgi:hypothetical protein
MGPDHQGWGKIRGLNAMNTNHSKLGLAACLAALLLALPAQAQQLYRWTDAQGKVHMSDKPPPEGTPGVSKEALPKDEVSPATRKAAQDRAAAEKAKAQQMENTRRAATQPAKPASAVAGAKEAPRNETDCQRQRRLFDESGACWGEFRLANGASRPGALEKCGPPVEDPTPRCPLR